MSEIIVFYKEVGKKPVLQKIENNIETFEKILGGEMQKIKYEEITIFFKKDNQYLRPNIYLSSNFIEMGVSVRGTIIVTLEENNTFKSFNKQQAVKYGKFLVDESFNYEHFDENGRYIKNKRKKKFSNKSKSHGQFVLEKDNSGDSFEKNELLNSFNAEDVLTMILEFQTAILKFIKKMSE